MYNELNSTTFIVSIHSDKRAIYIYKSLPKRYFSAQASMTHFNMAAMSHDIAFLTMSNRIMTVQLFNNNKLWVKCRPMSFKILTARLMIPWN